MAYAKVDALRLRYIATHQREIRVDLYENVRDAMAVDAELGQPEQRTEEQRKEAGQQPAIGRRAVLPATFIGGPVTCGSGVIINVRYITYARVT